mmetsp:Transcript_12769/g.22754  ORF Transcript_12769/g.22754 Transcript_12769/m.22754 type:complete len:436 (-) Transcript_12769:10-1317(-)
MAVRAGAAGHFRGNWNATIDDARHGMAEVATGWSPHECRADVSAGRPLTSAERVADLDFGPIDVAFKQALANKVRGIEAPQRAPPVKRLSVQRSSVGSTTSSLSQASSYASLNSSASGPTTSLKAALEPLQIGDQDGFVACHSCDDEVDSDEEFSASSGEETEQKAKCEKEKNQNIFQDQVDDESTASVLSFSSRKELLSFLFDPVGTGHTLTCTVVFNPSQKTWSFIQSGSGKELMTASVRRDRLKPLLPSIHFSIHWSPNCTEDTQTLPDYKELRDLRIAKVKSNLTRSSFEITKAGPKPQQKNANASFEQSDFKEKLGKVTLGMKGKVDKYRAAKLHIEKEACDTSTCMSMHTSPHLCTALGVASAASVKNTALFGDYAGSDDPCLVFGKVNRNTYTCQFKGPVNPVTAFAFCLSSICSYVTPGNPVAPTTE